MGARLVRGEAPDRAAMRARLREGGRDVRPWSSPPGAEFGWHQHPAAKVLYCLAGSIQFRTWEGTFAMRPGDRLELDAGTGHEATVGPEGVECEEAFR